MMDFRTKEVLSSHLVLWNTEKSKIKPEITKRNVFFCPNSTITKIQQNMNNTKFS